MNTTTQEHTLDITDAILILQYLFEDNPFKVTPSDCRFAVMDSAPPPKPQCPPYAKAQQTASSQDGPYPWGGKYHYYRNPDQPQESNCFTAMKADGSKTEGRQDNYEGECGDLRSINLSQKDMSGKNFAGANMRGAVLKSGIFLGADFSGARLDPNGLERTASDLSYANFDCAVLPKTRLEEAVIVGTMFKNADLYKTTLNLVKSGDLTSGQNVDFSGTNLISAQIKQALLPGAVMICAAAAQTDFSGSTLTNANFQWAYLKEANFTGANLNGADFRYADLRKANFTNASINSTIFNGARMDETSLATLPQEFQADPVRYGILLTDALQETDLLKTCGHTLSFEGGVGIVTAEQLSEYRTPKTDSLTATALQSSPDWAIWSNYHAMSSLIEIYKVTKDTAYLNRLIEFSDILLNNRDDKRGLQDQIRHRLVPGWGSFEYTYDTASHHYWYVHLGHIGASTYPMAVFIHMVYKDPALQLKTFQEKNGQLISYRDKADRYLDHIRESLDFADDLSVKEWQELSDGSGSYKCTQGLQSLHPLGRVACGLDENPYQVMPYNLQAAIGRAMLEMQQILPGTYYRNRAKKIGVYFLKTNSLESGGTGLIPHSQGDYYIWNYLRGGRLEDTGHATLDVDFMVQLYRNNLAVTQEDLQRFARTLRIPIKNSAGLSDFVNGTYNNDPGDDTDNNRACGRWLELTEVDPKVLGVCTNIRNILTSQDLDFDVHGYARYLKWLGTFP